GCRRRRAPPHLPLFSWPRARPAQATTRQKGHAERQAELAVALRGPAGSRRAVPQVHLLFWLIVMLCKSCCYTTHAIHWHACLHEAILWRRRLMSGIERLACFQHSIDQMEQLAHCCT